MGSRGSNIITKNKIQFFQLAILTECKMRQSKGGCLLLSSLFWREFRCPKLAHLSHPVRCETCPHLAMDLPQLVSSSCRCPRASRSCHAAWTPGVLLWTGRANSALWARLLGTFFDQISSHAEPVEWFGKRSGNACKITRQHSALPCFLASFSFSCITPCRVMGPIVLPVKKGNPFQPWQKLVVSSQNLVKLDHIPNFRGKQFKRKSFDNHHLLGCPDGT